MITLTDARKVTRTPNPGRVKPRCILAMLPKRSRSEYLQFSEWLRPSGWRLRYVNIRRIRAFNPFQVFELDGRTVADLKRLHVERRVAKQPGLFRWAPMRALYQTWSSLIARCSYAWAMREFRRPVQGVAVDSIVLNNGNRLPETAVAYAAKAAGIQTYFLENGLLPGTMQLDPVGVNAANSLSRDPDFYLRWDAEQGEAWSESGRERAEVAPPARAQVFLVPLQIDHDTQILRHGAWIRSMAHLVEVVSRLALARPGDQFLIREHPLTRRRLAATMASELPGNCRFENAGGLDRALQNCTAVITVNSTCGMEALEDGKPVVVLGEACYALPGLVLGARDENELFSALDALPDFRPSRRLWGAFRRYLMEIYLVVPGPEGGRFDRLYRALQRQADGQYAASRPDRKRVPDRDGPGPDSP